MKRPGRGPIFPLVALFLASCVGAAPAPGVGTPTPRPPTPTPSAARTTGVVATPRVLPTVTLYFSRDANESCTEVVPARRTVEAATPANALRALLAGPTPDERAAGAWSWFSADTADALLDVRVDDGTAVASFRDLRSVIPNASSSCGSAALLTELDRTLLGLPGISRARYSFGGDESAFYEWLQMATPSE